MQITYSRVDGADETRARAIMAAVTSARMTQDGQQWTSTAGGSDRSEVLEVVERHLDEIDPGWRAFIRAS